MSLTKHILQMIIQMNQTAHYTAVLLQGGKRQKQLLSLDTSMNMIIMTFFN